MMPNSEENKRSLEAATNGLQTTVADEEKALEESKGNYIVGYRLHLITLAVCLVLFLTNLEVPIVSTSLVGITSEIGGFDKSSWVVTAYLLTYVGFLIIIAKLSDIVGRKRAICVTIATFIIFSAACGGAQTINQLIIFRAFQGIGGSGIYALGQIIAFELVPKAKWPAYMGIVSGVFSLSLLLGPVLGGAINNGGAWRWIFLLNIPVAAVGLFFLVIFLPGNFPFQGQQVNSQHISILKRVDFGGASLLLTATVLLVSGLEEAGIEYAWKSPFVISVLSISGLVWIAFFFWSHYVTTKKGDREPVFPWRFLQSRVFIGALLCAFFTGPAFSVAIFTLPQRFELVNGATPLHAGVQLLPFTVACPIASFSAAMAAGKAKIPPVYLVIGAAVLQIVGFSLLTTIPNSETVSAAQYGYEVLAGFGTGVNISTVVLMAPYLAQEQDRAVAVGSINQVRYMGGAIALAVTATVLNTHVQSLLHGFLDAEQVAQILSTASIPSTFNPALVDRVREALGSGYTLQMKILTGFAAGQLPAALMMLQRKQLVV